MTEHVVVHFDGSPMPLILYVGEPCFLSVPQILDRYAESHGFERKDLTGYWSPLLDYRTHVDFKAHPVPIEDVPVTLRDIHQMIAPASNGDSK